MSDIIISLRDAVISYREDVALQGVMGPAVAVKLEEILNSCCIPFEIKGTPY